MALTMLKIAVVAPMPSARVRIATPVEVAFFQSMRAPKRRSCRKDSMGAALLVVDLVSETRGGTLWQACLFQVIVHRILLSMPPLGLVALRSHVILPRSKVAY